MDKAIRIYQVYSASELRRIEGAAKKAMLTRSAYIKSAVAEKLKRELHD